MACSLVITTLIARLVSYDKAVQKLVQPWKAGLVAWRPNAGLFRSSKSLGLL